MTRSNSRILPIALAAALAAAGCAAPTGGSRGAQATGAPKPADPTGPSASGTRTAQPPSATGAPGNQVSEAELALRQPLDPVEASQMRERSIAMLERFALDPWALLRANAIEGMQAAPARLEPIVRAGLADENPGVRYVAAMTVGLQRMTAVRAAVTPLVQDSDPSVAAAATFALIRIGEDPDRTMLASLLMRGTARARANAAYILGELGDSSAEPMLLDAGKRLATPGGDPTIGPGASRLLRLHVALALVKLGLTDQVQTLRAALYPSAVEELECAVAAAQMLGEVKDEGSIAQLVRMIEYRISGKEDWKRVDTNDPFLYPIELRLAAATSLAKMGQKDGVYVAFTGEKDPNAAIRAQSTFLYAAVGGPPAARKLAGMLEDPNPEVQLAAAAGLIRVLDGRGVVSRGR